MRRFLWLLFLPMVYLFIACDKEEALPGGSNTITCKVNGENFKTNIYDWKKKPANAAIIKDTLGVAGASSEGDKFHSVEFRIENFSGKGTYIVDTKNDNFGRYSLNGVHTYTDKNYTGQVVVTHYIPEKGILAGTFSYTTVDPNTGEIYHITDGKFDMTYTTQ